MRGGLRRLLRLTTSSPVKAVDRSLSSRARLVLGANPDGSLAALIEDCADAAVDQLTPDVVWTRADFDGLRTRVAAELVAGTSAVVGRVEKVLAAAHEVRLALPGDPGPAQLEAVEDIRGQFRRLLSPGFVAATGTHHLADLTRWITAIGRRLERLDRDLDTDRGRMLRVHTVTAAYDELVAALPPVRAAAEDVRDVGRLIEELRVSLWAQQLGTSRTVSEKRIYAAIDAISP